MAIKRVFFMIFFSLVEFQDSLLMTAQRIPWLCKGIVKKRERLSKESNK